MKLESSFSVRAPIDEVWAALLDVERVVPCLPGAQVLERQDDDAYHVQLDLELASEAASYRGRVTLVEHDRGGRRAVLSVVASEADGEGRAEAQVLMSVVEKGQVTQGTLAADLSLSGQARVAVDVAALGEVAERLTDRFARNLAAVLGGGVASVNGSDPESSMARAPAPVGEIPPSSRPMQAAAAAGPARVQSGEAAAAATEPAPPQEPDEPSAPAAEGSGAGSRAGAPRQAGATVERLRSPLGAMLLTLLIAALLGRRCRGRAGASSAGATGPATAPEPAA